MPQAHASLVAGRWDRSKYKGAELYGKTLGVIGFGRIGQLVAKRAQSFDMEILAYDKFVSADRFRELGAEGCDELTDLLGRADLVTLHTPRTPETEGLIDAEAIAAMKDGARLVNCARGELVVLDDLLAGLESGKLAGAALDVFPAEPFTEHPIFAREDVVVTPHLGASTAEAQDRAGVVTAEQVTEALSGGVVTNAVNIAAVRPEEMEALAPFVPLCEKLGRLAQGLGTGSVDRVKVEFRGKLAAHDTRLLGIAVLVGILSGNTETPVNLVNAPQMAEERGIELAETKESGSEDFTELVTVRLGSGDAEVEVAGTGVGPRNEPYLVSAWGESFYLPFAEHITVLPLRRPAGDDRPGRDCLRRGGREHRLRRSRRRTRRRLGGDGTDHRCRGAPRGAGDDPRPRRLLDRPHGRPLGTTRRLVAVDHPALAPPVCAPIRPTFTRRRNVRAEALLWRT